MPARAVQIESVFGDRASQNRSSWLQHADILIAVLGAFGLAWTADQLTGRRGLFATSLVSGVAAIAGWFLAVRVFAVSTMVSSLLASGSSLRGPGRISQAGG